MYLEITIMEMISSDSIFDLGFFEGSHIYILSDDADLAMNSNNPNFKRSVAMSPDYRIFFN